MSQLNLNNEKPDAKRRKTEDECPEYDKKHILMVIFMKENGKMIKNIILNPIN